jgi:hypothetical protein
VVLAASVVAAAAAMIAVILVPRENHAVRVTTTAPSTVTTAAVSTTVPPATTEPPAGAGQVSPSSGAPGTEFSGTTWVRERFVIPGENRHVELWFVADSPDGVRTASAYAGTATITSTGAVTFVGIVPQVMGAVSEPWGRFEPGTVFPTQPGRYHLALGPMVDQLSQFHGFGDLVFSVTQPGAGLPEPTVEHHVVDPGQTLLGTNDLAGVAFGTSADTAIAVFTAHFGSPDQDSGWQEGCASIERRVTWGGLSARFVADVYHAAEADDGTFRGYTYGDAASGPTSGLETASGVRVGIGLSELRGREPSVTFRAPYDGVALALWSTDSGLAGHLLRDVTAPDTTVTWIGAGDHGFLTVC